MKIDWVSKLTSRKFWVAVAGLISGLIIFFGGAEATATQITALIMSAASVVAYILGEGLIDAAGAQTLVVPVPEVEKTDPPDGLPDPADHAAD